MTKHTNEDQQFWQRVRDIRKREKAASDSAISLRSAARTAARDHELFAALKELARDVRHAAVEAALAHRLDGKGSVDLAIMNCQIPAVGEEEKIEQAGKR